jgi:putative phage-type endonuclease
VLVGNPYKGVYELALEKLGRIPPDDSADSREAVYWGRVLEAPVAKRYSEVTGRKVRRQPHLTSKEYPWMIGNIDRQIVGDHRGPGVLEVKTQSAWGTTIGDVDDLPPHYYGQLQHYLITTGYSWGAFAVLVGGQSLRHFEVEADVTYQKDLIELERWFWHDVVQAGQLPAIDAKGEGTMTRMFPVGQELTITCQDEQLVRYAHELVSVKSELNTLEDRKGELTANLKAYMGEANVMQLPGFGRVTWKNTKPVSKTVADVEALVRLTAKLRDIHPDVAEMLELCVTTTTMPGSRRFLTFPEATK